MNKIVTNHAASVRARLLTLSHNEKVDFQRILQRYVCERFLYRLGASLYRERFVLKGAMLFVLWNEMPARPTKDLDLAGYLADDPDQIEKAVREIAGIEAKTDGLEFDLATLTIIPIRDAQEYHGFRITMNVGLAGAVVRFRIDVGFGDVVVPHPAEVRFPVLLNAEAPVIRAYPREASVAEKLHAMVTLGEANTRYKDFFDIDVISRLSAFDGATLRASIAATFSRRGATRFDTWPVALTSGFYADTARGEQWRRFLQRLRLATETSSFDEVGERVIAFLELPFRAIASDGPFNASWPVGGPWK